MVFFFFKQKTAYEMRISGWSSDVCSSDLTVEGNMPRKRKPSASVAGRKGAVAACAATPSSAMATKQKARLPACSFQLRMPCSTSSRGRRTPLRKKRRMIAAVDTPCATGTAAPRTGSRQIGRAHVSTPVTNAHLVCRLLLEKKKTQPQEK